MPNNDYANEPNQSRSEDIIQSILDNTEYDEEARSRIEYLLIELKNAIEGGGGGGGGVTSYSPLTEKPKIDNHTLQAGNNTSSDLGLQTKLTFDSAPTESSTNPVTSGGVYTALAAKANSADVYSKTAVDTALSNKADKSTTYTKTEVDTSLSNKADKSTTYTKTEVDTALRAKANAADVYSKSDVDTALGDKANADNVYKLALSDADLLPANTDLDNVKTVGCYYVYDSVNVTTITNRPTNNTSAFRLTVEYAAGEKRARQIYQEFNSFDKYIRWENSSNVFSEWEKVECDLSTKQNTISDLTTIRSGAALGTTAVQPETGKGLSTNDYTTAEKTKLAGIAEGAEVNVQSNWAQSSTTADDYIKNKPTLGTASALDVAASGNASTSQVVKGNDTRLTDARNAADVSSWAKEANKPSYNGSEIALSGYAEAQSKSNVAATDTTNAAIGKLEYRVETNENNISSIKEKTDNIMIDSNRNIYIQATAPTGTIPVGSTWISGGSLKGYVQESNVSTVTIEQGTFNPDGSESPNNNRVRTTFDTDIYSMGAYTVSITGANDVLVFVYDSDKTCIQSEGSNGWKSLPYSFNLAGDRYVRFAFRKTYDAAISPSDVSNYALAFQGWK